VTDAATPTLQRLMLGEELRHIRESLGKTIEQVSQELSERLGPGFSTAKISRLETAKRGITLRDVRDLCEYYEVGSEERERLIAMAKASRGNRLQGINEALSEYVALESIASAIYAYESMLVPGLLQTRDYSRAIADGNAGLASGGVPPDPAVLEEQLDVRAARQNRLRGADAVRFVAIMDENVVRRRVGPPRVMAAQLRHIAEVSEYPNVTVRVVPIESGAYPGFESAGFSVLEFPEDSRRSPVCFLEGAIGALWAERDADRQRITEMIHYMQDIALSPERTRALLDEAARGLE
jgi:transcriptional regulator with XRE-family HTH domain